MTLVLIQLALLLLTAWGWGTWLWKLSHAAALPGWRRFGWFFFGLAGYMSCELFLSALVYFNLPLKWTSWIGLLIAVGGVLLSLRDGALHSAGSLRARRWDLIVAAVIFAVVFGAQGADLCHATPENYYGNAHTDQVNYVLLAEFLIEKPFSTSIHDIGLHPWIAKALTLKVYRIGQSVANGYLGVISLTDAKQSYGTLSIFSVALGAVAVFMLARVLSTPRLYAGIIGLWWGILPAITKMHLDGFFSQACILFVFPALAALFYVRRGRIERTQIVLSTIYLGFLLSTYTEVYILGVGLFFALVILAAWPGTLLRVRIAAMATGLGGSLLLSGLYLQYLLHYMVLQYQVASTPLALADLVPQSGTWEGWKQIYFGYATTENPSIERVLLLAGLALVFLIGCAFQAPNLRQRRFLLALLAPPTGVLALLLSAPHFQKYPFSKLLDTFTTTWVVLAALGLWHFTALVTRMRALRLGFVTIVAAALTVAALRGSWPQWLGVWHDGGILSAVDAPGARLCYELAEKEHAQDYLVAEPHNIVCAWLAYAARRSNVYIDADTLSDLPLPIETYAFRQIPRSSKSLVVLDDSGPKRIGSYNGPPTIIVRNPQGIDGDGSSTFYWIGPDASIDLQDYTDQGDSVHRYWLKFNASAGPANPSTARVVGLLSPDGTLQRVEFDTQIASHFVVNVRPGKNVFTFKVISPTEQTFRIPTDPRDHMVRVENLSLSLLPPADQPDAGTGAAAPR